MAYWEERQRLFGPEKYLMRMTLNGALRDDLSTIQAGIFSILPHRDASGRILLFRHMARRVPEQHSPESVVRAVTCSKFLLALELLNSHLLFIISKVRLLWYLLEIISVAQESSDCGKVAELVFLIWEKNMTLWDYDRKLEEHLNSLERFFLPVRLVSFHVFCVTPIVVSVFKPIGMSLMDKISRHRTIIHDDVTEKQVPELLAGFGILEGMLPTEMGGMIKLDHPVFVCPPLENNISSSATALCQMKTSLYIDGQTTAVGMDSSECTGSAKVEGSNSEQRIRTQKEKPPMESMQLIRQSKDVSVRTMDVLCGRGKSSVNHGKVFLMQNTSYLLCHTIFPHTAFIQSVGNRHFQDVISKSLPEYNSCDKSHLVNAIIAQINNAGGRFLKHDPVTGNWYALGNAQVKKKVGYALRDGNNSLKKMGNKCGRVKGTPLGTPSPRTPSGTPSTGTSMVTQPNFHQDSASTYPEKDVVHPELPSRNGPTPPKKIYNAPFAPTPEPTTGFVVQPMGKTEAPQVSSHIREFLRQSKNLTITPADVLCGKEKTSVNHG